MKNGQIALVVGLSLVLMYAIYWYITNNNLQPRTYRTIGDFIVGEAEILGIVNPNILNGGNVEVSDVIAER
jgi:hypothetical protein